MDLPKLNELIESLSDSDQQEAPVKAILLALRGSMLVNRQRAMLDHLVPWIRADRARNLREMVKDQASRN